MHSHGRIHNVTGILHFLAMITYNKTVFVADVERERSSVATSIYNSICVPELGFLDYQGNIIPEDRKPVVNITPVGTSTPAAPSNNNFIHEGEHFF